MRVFDLIYSKNRSYPNDIALNYYNHKITYSELFDNIHKTAKSFKALDVKEGDIVTLCMPSLPETIYSFYALNRIGAVVNLVDPRYNPEKIKKIVNDTKSNILIFIDVSINKIQDIEAEICSTRIISVSPSDSLPNVLKYSYNVKELLLGKHNKKYMTWNAFIDAGQSYNKEYDCRYSPNSPVAIVYMSKKYSAYIILGKIYSRAPFRVERIFYERTGGKYIYSKR